MPLTTVDQGLLSTNAQYTGFKNRVINGDMVINQRGLTLTNRSSGGSGDGYAVDRFRDGGNTFSTGRWSLQQLTDAPAGFTNSLGLTVTTAQPSISGSDLLVLAHMIEGFNVSDLAWGTANAQPVTLSFWVKVSATGQYSVTFQNGSATGVSYNATYTVNAANTWEYKTITVPGPTSGSWATNNTTGIRLDFTLASATFQTANSWVTPTGNGTPSNVNIFSTNGNIFRITGVQLERGQTATSFDVLPYGTELFLCQRYYQEQGMVLASFQSPGVNTSRTINYSLNPEMRVTPTVAVPAVGEFTNIATTNRLGNTNKLVCIEGTVGNSGNYGFVDKITFSAEL